MIKKDKKSEHIKGLDGLRGIAVIGVVLYHMFPSVIKGGFLGVSLFFVLSGYLIAVTSESAWVKEKFTILSFYKKRIKRIYPALIIMLLMTTGILMVINKDLVRGIRKELISIFLNYNNWWQVMQNGSYFTKINNATPFTHLWSLSIEMQFYLVWPIIFLLYKRFSSKTTKKSLIYLFIIPALISVFSMMFIYKPNEDPSRVYYGSDTRAFSLLLGAYLGLCFRRKKIKVMKKSEIMKKIMVFNFCMISVIILYICMDGKSDITYRGGMLFATLIFMEIISLCSSSQIPIGKWLDIRLLSWIGERSYEIYLCQYPVIYFFAFKGLNDGFISSILQIIVILSLSIWLHEAVMYKANKQKYLIKRRLVHRSQFVYEEV